MVNLIQLVAIKEQKIQLEEDRLKDERIKQRQRLRDVIQEQEDRSLQEELFSRLEAFEIDKTKKN